MKILLVDDNQARADAVMDQLKGAGITIIVLPQTGESLAEAVIRHAPDVVIVDMSRPDRDSLDGIREVSSHTPYPIVMFVDEDDVGFMEEAIDAGVSSYNIVGSAVPDVKPIVKAAVAIFKRYQSLAGKLQRAEATLKERAVIQRAKTLLMKQHKMLEPQAHRWMRRQAMNSGRRMVDIAAELLKESGEPL